MFSGPALARARLVAPHKGDAVAVPQPRRHVLKKATQERFKYCNVQMPLPKELAVDIIAWGKKNIPDADLFNGDLGYATGRTLDSHITLKWGLANDSDATHATRIVGKHEPFKLKLGTVRKFTCEEKNYDVIYVAVASSDMRFLHRRLSKIPGSVSTHATYSPHVTVAYVKRGTADHLIGSSKFEDKSFEASMASFMKMDGSEVKILMLGKREVKKSILLELPDGWMTMLKADQYEWSPDGEAESIIEKAGARVAPSDLKALYVRDAKWITLRETRQHMLIMPFGDRFRVIAGACSTLEHLKTKEE